MSWTFGKNWADDDHDEQDDRTVCHNRIVYGDQCKDGSHDHRFNRGEDRTPSQKEGDSKRRR